MTKAREFGFVGFSSSFLSFKKMFLSYERRGFIPKIDALSEHREELKKKHAESTEKKIEVAEGQQRTSDPLQG
jgi:hypothetical protein